MSRFITYFIGTSFIWVMFSVLVLSIGQVALDNLKVWDLWTYFAGAAFVSAFINGCIGYFAGKDK